jgi:hypothetical protein
MMLGYAKGGKVKFQEILDAIEKRHARPRDDWENMKPYEGEPKGGPVPSIEELLRSTGYVQRGDPEMKMLEAQSVLGGGVMNVAVEHLGDLTHRLSEVPRFGRGALGNYAPKVNRGIALLDSKYGFRKEHNENLDSNARYRRERGESNLTDGENYLQAKDILREYANEHRKVPVYNVPQWYSRQVPIDLGEGRYYDALEKLKRLKNMMDSDPDYFIQRAGKAPGYYEEPSE